MVRTDRGFHGATVGTINVRFRSGACRIPIRVSRLRPVAMRAERMVIRPGAAAMRRDYVTRVWLLNRTRSRLEPRDILSD